MATPVRAARERGVLEAVRPFVRFTPGGLGVIQPDNRVAVSGTRSVVEPRLWLLGYGDGTDPADATILGVGRYTRATAAQIIGVLG
jgi:hypothetical protein